MSSQVSASTTLPDFLAAAEHLIGPVDAFFDNVFVMADDEGVRRNRLALLRCSEPQECRRSSCSVYRRCCHALFAIVHCPTLLCCAVQGCCRAAARHLRLDGASRLLGLQCGF